LDLEDALHLLCAVPERTGIFTDFDGTLSEIVNVPQAAVATGGAAEILEVLAGRFAVVAVVSGRSLEDLRLRLDVDGVLLAGSYGRERSDRSGGRRPAEGWEPVAAAATAMIADLQGVVLERKGAGVALHYRAVPELEETVRERAAALASEFELDVLPGRLVAELVAPGPGKADAIASIVADHDLQTLLVAGDDVADLEAFDWAKRAEATSVLVAVSSEEAPPGLEASADVVVGSPAELVALLKKLA
jgi:trehalose 6-phosphate phosphatase